MRLAGGFGRLAVFVTMLLFISSALPGHAARVKDDASGPTPTAKRELKRDGIRVAPVAPKSFDQELQDMRDQILDRVPTERNRGGSLLGWLRDWLSRPTDIVHTLGQAQGDSNSRSDDDDDDDDDHEDEEHEDHESPSTP